MVHNAVRKLGDALILRQAQYKSLGLLIIIVLLATACGGASTPASPEPSATPTRAIVSSEPNQSDVAPRLPRLQDNRIKFERFSLEHGLSQTSIMCILQDREGFMWFGTEDGLNKYDGYNFTWVKHDPENPNSLSNNFIESIHEDQTGMLWIGTRGGGLDRYDREIGQFTHYQHDPNDPYSLSNDDVQSVYEDASGVLWIGTDGGGLNRFDRETGQFAHYQHDPNDPHSLSDNSVLAIHQDREGVLWIGTTDGLNRFELEAARFTHYKHDPDDPRSLSHNTVLSVCEDREGGLWIGTYEGGLNRFDRETEQFIHYQNNPNDPHSLSNNAVWSVYEDQLGVLWIGTYEGGLNRFDRETERFIHYQNDPLDPHSLTHNYVFSIYEDQGGVFWVGTFGGLNRFDPLSARFVHYQNDPNDSNSLNENRVWSIYEDQEGMLWIGTYGGGLNRFDRETGHWRYYQNDPNDPHSLSNDAVRSVYQDREGVLWIGTNGGLNRFDQDNNRFIRYQNNRNDPYSLSHNRVWPIYEDQAGVLWIGTWSGLNRLDRSSGRFTHYLINADDPRSFDNTVWVTHEDRSGVFWIGTAGGLARFDRETGQFTRYQHDPDNPNSLSNDFVFTIHEDQSGGLWIGTWGGGLNRLDPAEETFVHYREKDGLPNDVVYGILEDDQGNLWLSTNRGLSKFNPRTGIFRNYDVSDGLQSNEFNNGAYHKSSSGEMFFGGINGFNAFYPEQVKDNSYIPPVVLTELTQSGEDVDAGKAVESITEVTFRWPRNFFEFEYAALSYAQPEKNRYAYMLEGFDPDWIGMGTRRFGRYTNVPGGTYTLRIIGSNNDGVWNEEGTAVRITVTPPFWATWWFRGIVLLVLVGGVIGGYRLRVKSIEARSRELEDQVEERTAELSRTNALLEQEIAERKRAEEALAQQAAEAAVLEERQRLARELHDSVTQALYGATLYAEATARQLTSGEVELAADHLRELRDTTQEALREMRLLIFELRPLELEKEGLVAALQARLEAVEGRAGLETEFNVERCPECAEGGEGRLPPEIEEGLYRIAQETLNNVLKHAQAHKVIVSLRQDEQTIRLEVSDDGIGFDPTAAQETGGLGLSGITERVALMGGSLEIESAPGAGTRVRVEVPQ